MTQSPTFAGSAWVGRVSGMKRGLVAGSAVALLLLTGCTATTAQEAPLRDETATTAAPTPPVEAPAAEASASASAAPVEVSAAPPTRSAVDDVLVGIQLTVAGYGVDVTADQIKSAADYTCDQIASGADQSSITALSGDIPERANRYFVQLTANEYCGIR